MIEPRRIDDALLSPFDQLEVNEKQVLSQIQTIPSTSDGY